MGEPPTIVRRAPRVERLAYTRAQAAEALGISRSTTFICRVLPYVVDGREAVGRQADPGRRARATPHRRSTTRQAASYNLAPPREAPEQLLSARVLEQIRTERRRRASLRQIAAGLNADGTPTAHGGMQWWPSTVRSALARSDRAASTAPQSAKAGPPAVLVHVGSPGVPAYQPDCCRTTSRSATRQEGRQHSRPRVPDGRAVEWDSVDESRLATAPAGVAVVGFDEQAGATVAEDRLRPLLADRDHLVGGEVDRSAGLGEDSVDADPLEGGSLAMCR